MSESETTNEGGAAAPGPGASGERRAGRRLPPPAFPPGGGRAPAGATREARPGHEADAAISPGDDERLEAAEVLLAEDPPVVEVAEMVGRLARALRLEGKAALQVTPEMSPFEATLRAYCVGYIAGRRGEDEQV